MLTIVLLPLILCFPMVRMFPISPVYYTSVAPYCRTDRHCIFYKPIDKEPRYYYCCMNRNQPPSLTKPIDKGPPLPCVFKGPTSCSCSTKECARRG